MWRFVHKASGAVRCGDTIRSADRTGSPHSASRSPIRERPSAVRGCASRTTATSQRLQTYEFLHATFGEFLVARLVVRILTDLVAREAAATLPLRPAAADDALLYSLLSFAPLTARGAILPFVSSFISET
ncbi:MAG: hypothetical protein V7603_2591, partial [Micromonosporaceae bacterium]